MSVSCLLAAFTVATFASSPTTPDEAPADNTIYQLRIYHTAPGKLPVLLERFGSRNLPIFERHGIRLVGAWTPTEQDKANQLVYVVAFPGREAADKAWADFSADPEWKSLYAAERETHGTVVEKADITSLTPTAYSMHPGADTEASSAERLYILRTYITPPGKLEALNARFRDHTIALFRKHGLDSVFYATPSDANQGAENTLIYFLSVPNRESADASWAAFRDDPEWQRVKARTEEQGSLTERVESLYLKPTPFSPLK